MATDCAIDCAADCATDGQLTEPLGLTFAPLLGGLPAELIS